MKITKSSAVLSSIFFLLFCEVRQRANTSYTTPNTINHKAEYPQGNTYIDTGEADQNEGRNKADNNSEIVNNNKEKQDSPEDDISKEGATWGKFCSSDYDRKENTLSNQADFTLAVSRPCSWANPRDPKCIGMRDLDIMDVLFSPACPGVEVEGSKPKEKGPCLCPKITKIAQKTYLLAPTHSGEFVNFKEIYFVKVKDEETLREFCSSYNTENIDFSKNFLLLFGGFFYTDSERYDFGLARKIKVFGKKIFVEIYPYDDWPVHFMVFGQSYAWDSAILPREYYDYDVLFVWKGFADGSTFLLDWCPYSNENIEIKKVKAEAIDFERCDEIKRVHTDGKIYRTYLGEATKYPSFITFWIEGRKGNYSQPITTQIFTCDFLSEDEYIILPSIPLDFYKLYLGNLSNSKFFLEILAVVHRIEGKIEDNEKTAVVLKIPYLDIWGLTLKDIYGPNIKYIFAE